MSKIPHFFQTILWSYKLSGIDPQKNSRTVLVQTINFGNWRHWQWVKKFYGRKQIQKTLQEIPKSEFRPSALKLAQLLFGVKQIKYASRSAYIRRQKDLAKT